MRKRTKCEEVYEEEKEEGRARMEKEKGDERQCIERCVKLRGDI